MYIFFNVNIIITLFFRLAYTLYVQISTQHSYIVCIEHFIDVLNANLREKVSVNIVIDVEIELTYF
jgi:hypothetical protein